MTLCEKHWSELKRSIDDKCLLDWESRDSTAPVFEDLDPVDEPSFKPLLRAACSIYAQALAVAPDFLNADDLNSCVICLLANGLMQALENTMTNLEHLRGWVNFAANQQLDFARQTGSATLLQ